MDFVDVELEKDRNCHEIYAIYRYLLFDWCGIWIRDGLGGIRPIVEDPFECGTGIESDGLLRFITGGLVKDAESTTTSESVVVSSIFLVFSFFF
jgi:hypothetical protein